MILSVKVFIQEDKWRIKGIRLSALNTNMEQKFGLIIWLWGGEVFVRDRRVSVSKRTAEDFFLTELSVEAMSEYNYVLDSLEPIYLEIKNSEIRGSLEFLDVDFSDSSSWSMSDISDLNFLGIWGSTFRVKPVFSNVNVRGAFFGGSTFYQGISFENCRFREHFAWYQPY